MLSGVLGEWIDISNMIVCLRYMDCIEVLPPVLLCVAVTC